MKMRLFFLVGVFGFLSLIKTTSAQYAAAVAAPTILIEKKVGRPADQSKGGISLEYVDNLGTSDYKFKPGQDVFFQLSVKNGTGQTLSSVTVRDTVPVHLEPVEGPGSYDEKTKVITIDIGSFAHNEEKIYTLKMRVAPQNQLPGDKGLFCLLNKAEVKADTVSDEDTAQFCIEKEVVGVKKVPSAGPAFGSLLLAGELGLLTVGLFFKKYL